jgi:anti-sigma28 factor (negative regulator of flagellin synthesis)
MNADAVARQIRVQHLRQLVASGTYRVSPQRLALKILVKALRER